LLPRLYEAAEKLGEDAKSSPQARKRGHMFNGSMARLKSGPSQNLRESWCFEPPFARWAVFLRRFMAFPDAYLVALFLAALN
jgi:hypothetical protein